MARTTTKGTCHFCQQVFGKAAMTRHLETCPQRAVSFATSHGKTPAGPARFFHLRAEGLDVPSYWMHLEIPADASLQTLDSFLRKSWLECCGHLSRFEIHGTSYSSYIDPEFGDKSMRAQVGKILEVGDQFVHEYDFGTTTELRLKVLAEREGVPQKKAVELLAHNILPVIPCDICGKPATQICSQCIYEEGGWLCELCAPQHECGEEMLLPVVNSPRVGMCGYDGPGL
ncbi:IS1096 element passenger TnpR family protein [Dictyobacter vulcani]|uniref:IS1096 element passenger TnpR family protein n=1 Tax=Dictyobacter vulcani TaxID=2607529 RepID=UPI00124FA1EA|nr:hypothetical protein [Dictyobacter vulcani]